MPFGAWILTFFISLENVGVVRLTDVYLRSPYHSPHLNICRRKQFVDLFRIESKSFLMNALAPDSDLEKNLTSEQLEHLRSLGLNFVGRKLHWRYYDPAVELVEIIWEMLENPE